MFKILTTVTTNVYWGISIHQIILEYSSEDKANLAHKKLIDEPLSGNFLRISIKLY